MRFSDLPEAFERVLTKPGLADLGPGPRLDVLSQLEITHTLERVRVPKEVAELIRALLLLWNDHHNPAHEIVQERETPDGNLIHAILHRREPDYGNARYWFHRVGVHPCYEELAKRVETFLASDAQSSDLGELVKDGQWNPEAFVTTCQREASQANRVTQRVALQKIQEIETRVLLHYLINSEM